MSITCDSGPAPPEGLVGRLSSRIATRISYSNRPLSFKCELDASMASSPTHGSQYQENGPYVLYYGLPEVSTSPMPVIQVLSGDLKQHGELTWSLCICRLGLTVKMGHHRHRVANRVTSLLVLACFGLQSVAVSIQELQHLPLLHLYMLCLMCLNHLVACPLHAVPCTGAWRPLWGPFQCRWRAHHHQHVIHPHFIS